MAGIFKQKSRTGLSKVQLAAIWAKRIRRDRSRALSTIKKELVDRRTTARNIRKNRSERFQSVSKFFPKLHEQELERLVGENYMHGAGPGQFDLEMRQRVASKLRRLRSEMGVSKDRIGILGYEGNEQYRIPPTDWIKKQQRNSFVATKRVRSRIKNALIANKSPFPARYETHYLADRLRGKHEHWLKWSPFHSEKKTNSATHRTLMKIFDKERYEKLPPSLRGTPDPKKKRNR